VANPYDMPLDFMIHGLQPDGFYLEKNNNNIKI